MMPKQTTHGGSRPPVREDDGRLTRKIVKPKRVTLIIEQNDFDQLFALYGNNPHGYNWQDAVRDLIAAHLGGS